MRPFVSHIKSNLKGGIDCELARKTIVVGKNGTGKSAVVNAVELALTGRASDLSGRTVVSRESDLLALAPARAGELYAEVTIEPAGKAKWETKGTTESAARAKVKRSDLVDPETAFPLRAVLEAVLGAPATARKFFLARAVANVTALDVRRLIPSSLHKLLDASGAGAPPGSIVDQLLYALDHAKAKGAETTVRAKMAKSLATSGVVTPPSTDELIRAEADYRSALTLLSESSALLIRREAALKGKEMVVRLRAKWNQVDSALDATEALREQVITKLTAEAQEQPIVETIPAIMATMEWMVKAKAKACLTCGLDVSEVDMSLRLITIRTALDKINAAPESHWALKDHLTSIDEDILRMESDLVSIEQDLARAQVAIDQDPPATAPTSPAQAQELVSKAVDRLTKLRADKLAFETSRQAKNDLITMEREAQEWKQLHEALKNAVEVLLDGGVKDFVLRVRSFLPPTDLFDLRLRDGEREVVQFGFVRDGVLHTALSGAEWSRCVVALGGACLPPTGPAVIVPPAGEFDPDTLGEFLSGLSALDAQVIVCAPQRPTRLPPDWLLIDTATAVHRGAKLAAAKAEVDALEASHNPLFD